MRPVPTSLVSGVFRAAPLVAPPTPVAALPLMAAFPLVVVPGCRPVPNPFTFTPLASTAADPTGGTLPREDPENASPVDVPETDAPLVWPLVGRREVPLKASPLEVPEIDTPLDEPLDPA